MTDDIGELLEVHFPNLPVSWLEYINSEIGRIRQANGGSFEMHTRWSGMLEQWTDFTQRHFPERVKNK